MSDRTVRKVSDQKVSDKKVRQVSDRKVRQVSDRKVGCLLVSASASSSGTGGALRAVARKRDIIQLGLVKTRTKFFI